MAKARIAFTNHVLDTGTTLAASASATGYAVTNLKNHKRDVPWRSDSATGNQTVTASFSAATIKAVGLIDAVLHAGGSVKVETKNGGGAYGGFGGGAGTFTYPSPHRTGVNMRYDTTGVTATDVKITFVNTGAVAAAVELGGLWIATDAGLFVATVNVTDDLGHAPVDPSVERRALGGRKAFDTRAAFDRFACEFGWVSAAQKDALLAIWDAVGKHTPVILAIDPDDQNLTVLTRFLDSFGLRHATRDQWHVNLPCEEVR